LAQEGNGARGFPELSIASLTLPTKNGAGKIAGMKIKA